MAQNKTSKRTSTSDTAPIDYPLFEKRHFIIFGIGLGLIFLGLILMIGGGSDDPNVWDADAMYSFTRTVISPILILAGLGTQVYGILKK